MRAYKYQKIFDLGVDKVNESLNVTAMIKDNRALKISLEQIVLNEKVRREIDRHSENIIDLDDYDK